MNFNPNRVSTGTAPAPVAAIDCDKCGGACEKRISNSQKNPGREYYRCTACNNFCGWTDGVGNKFGAKRGRTESPAPSGAIAALEARLAALEQAVLHIENALIGSE